MSRRDPNVLRDGLSLITKGVNSGMAPVTLGRDELAWAVNATFRNGFATSRPGIQRRLLSFLTLAERNHFQDNIFEGAIFFQRTNQLVAMIGGRLFSIDARTYQVLDVSTSDLNPTNRYRGWLCEAESYIIAQDGQSAPWIYDGATTRRSDTFGIYGKREVPVGTAMCYGNGRLTVALPSGQQFVVGDLVSEDPATVIQFTENDIINEGGFFSIPINSGPITAIRPIAQIDTSTGQGPIQILTTGAVFSLNAPTDRTQWKNATFPIQTTSLVQSGALSDRATVNVNGDIWSRAFDGIRSFIVARREFSYQWVNAPMSQELTRITSRDDVNQLSFGSAAVFDNRLLMTVQPYKVWGHGVCHRALAVIDFAPIAYLSDKTPPAWEGIWTGLNVLQIVPANYQGIERCFVFALSSSNTIQLWELTKNAIADNNGTSDVPIEWSIETGAYTFPRAPGTESVPAQEQVSLDGGRVFVDEIQGTVSFSAFYHMDQDPCWRDWWNWSVCGQVTTCGTPGSTACTTVPTLYQQYRKPFFLPTPLESKDLVTNRNLNWGRECQGRLVVTGKCRLKRWEFDAHDTQEDVVGLPAASESCIADSCSNCVNEFTYAL